MRLSDIKGDRCFDVIAELVVPISNIAQDKEAMKLFERKKTPKGKTPTEFFIARFKAGLPALLKSHKQDFVAIMAAIEGVEPEKYLEGLNMAKLVGDVVGLLTDEEFLAFLS